MGKSPKQTFYKRGNPNGQQIHEKMFKITSNQGNANQNHNEISPHPSQNGCPKEINKCQMLVRIWGKTYPNSLWVGTQTGKTTMEVSLESPQKPEYNPTIQPSHPTPWNLPKGN